MYVCIYVYHVDVPDAGDIEKIDVYD
jgi:hypothetical protein